MVELAADAGELKVEGYFWVGVGGAGVVPNQPGVAVVYGFCIYLCGCTWVATAWVASKAGA